MAIHPCCSVEHLSAPAQITPPPGSAVPGLRRLLLRLRAEVAGLAGVFRDAWQHVHPSAHIDGLHMDPLRGALSLAAPARACVAARATPDSEPGLTR